jgi:hypothetical protein
VHRLLTRALILETAMLITTVSLAAQDTTVSRAPAIEVSMRLQKDKVPVGQSPWAALRVENLTDRGITIDQADPHVEGDKGELPMKPNPRIITDGANHEYQGLERWFMCHGPFRQKIHPSTSTNWRISSTLAIRANTRFIWK